MMTGLNNITGKEFPAWEQSVSSVDTGRSQRGNGVDTTSTSGANCQYVGLVLRSFRYVACLILMMVVGVGEMWGATITYHIINLGRLDNNGALTSDRTEALQFTSTSTTVGLPEKYKSPLAKNWQYYNSSDVTYDSSTKVCVFNSGPSLSVGDALSDGDHVYVTYELDKEKFREVGVYNRGIYKIRFPNKNGNNYYYLQQSTWYNNSTKQTEINTTSSAISNPTTNDYLWKFNIVDPYQITIQSQSDDYTNYYLSNKTGNTTFSDIRLQPTLAAAKGTYSWAFSLIPGGSDGTYRLIVTDGITASGNGLDSFGHGYLNNKRDNYKTTYHLYNQTNYDRCDLTIEPVTKNYIIVNNSGEPLVQALTEANTLEVPDVIKSPLASYTYYGTQQDAINEGTQLTSATGATIYVRYTTNNEVLNLKEEIKYNISVGGTNYLYASDATTLSSEANSENNANNTHKWILTGNDAYQIIIKNVGNSNEIAYNLSSSEAVYLSGTGSKFFFHQTNSGEYEMVAITSNDYSTPDYYTLGMGADNLKLYSNSGHPFGNASVQTVFTPRPMAAITTPPAANSLNYNGLNQELVTAGTASNGTMKYRLGDTGSYEETIPTAKDVNTYSVYYMAVGTDGYEDFFASEPIEVTINKQSIIVSGITASNKIYDGTETATLVCTNAVFEGKIGSDDLTIVSGVGTFDNKNVGTGKTVTITGLTFGGTAAGNYMLAESGNQSSITASISPLTATLSWTENLTYNGTNQAPTATVSNLCGTDDCTVTVTIDGDHAAAGDYTGTVSLEGTDAINYSLSSTSKDFTIAQKTIGLDWSGVSFTYDGNSHAPTATASELVGGDEITVSIELSPQAGSSLTQGLAINVGAYTATASTLTGDDANNYKLPDAKTQNFTIGKKSLGDGTTPETDITYTIDKNDNDQFVITVRQEGKTDPLIVGTEGTDFDYSLSTNGTTAKYYNAAIIGANNYEGGFAIRYAYIPFQTDANRAEWSGTFVAENAVTPENPDNSKGHKLPEGITAYIITSIEGDWAIPEALDYIPEGVPVLLMSDHESNGFLVEDASGHTPITTGTGEQVEKNMLEVRNAIWENVPAKTIYLLHNNEFVYNMAGDLAAGKVCLNPAHTVPVPSPAPPRLRIKWDAVSGITELQNDGIAETRNDSWYTIDGRKLNGMPQERGLYINGGKKVMVK